MPKPSLLPFESMHQLLSSDLRLAKVPAAYTSLEYLKISSFTMRILRKVRKDKVRRAVLELFSNPNSENAHERVDSKQGMVRIPAKL